MQSEAPTMLIKHFVILYMIRNTCLLLQSLDTDMSL